MTEDEKTVVSDLAGVDAGKAALAVLWEVSRHIRKTYGAFEDESQAGVYEYFCARMAKGVRSKHAAMAKKAKASE